MLRLMPDIMQSTCCGAAMTKVYPLQEPDTRQVDVLRCCQAMQGQHKADDISMLAGKGGVSA